MMFVVLTTACKKVDPTPRPKPAPDPSECIDKSKINPELLCPENIDFVCGCDGVTYNNACNAERSGVTSWTKGRCQEQENKCIDESKIRRDANCPQVYKPVCGCDGKTYGNACMAEVAGIQSWEPGACNNR